MGWKCGQCGFDNEGPERESVCGGCSATRPSHLVLVAEASGTSTEVRIRTEVGKYLLRTLVGEESRFASDPQFCFLHDEATGAWSIQHDARAANPTCLDGAPLTAEPAPLADGAIISIGPARAKLKVEVVRE